MNYGTGNFSFPTVEELNKIMQPQKQRRTKAKASRALPKNMPTFSGYGETVVVSNPFDDAPESMRTNNPNNHHQGQCFYNQNCLLEGNFQIPNYQHENAIGMHLNIPETISNGLGMQNWSESNNVQNAMQSAQTTQVPKRAPRRNARNPNTKRSQTAKRKQPSAIKIYPPGQPVIFNPNVPPIYPCGVCRKEVTENDQGIICESGCNFWFHRICLGLSEAAFVFLTREVFAEWACDNCIRTKNVPMVKYKPI